MLQTRFCERFGVAAPIVVAPMGPDLTGPELVAAVSNAGGFGILQAQLCSPPLLRDQIRYLRTLTDTHWRELRSPLSASCRHSGLHRRTSCGLIILLGRSF